MKYSLYVNELSYITPLPVNMGKFYSVSDVSSVFK